ncbi:MAG: hypothetical protein PVJ67_02270 [Candidatus Pacearchaeota archaeon]|jgi:hypothetical protein
MQIEECTEGIIAITGGGGTFAEIEQGIGDLELPFSYYSGSSKKLDLGLPIFGYENGSHNGRVLWSQNILEMVKHLEKFRR